MEQAERGGGPRGAVADADLDAWSPCSMPPPDYRAAAAGLGAAVPGQPVRPGDRGDTLAERAPRGDAVAVLTAHRSKGLEWDLVVVAGVRRAAGRTCASAGRCLAWIS